MPRNAKLQECEETMEGNDIPLFANDSTISTRMKKCYVHQTCIKQ